MFTPIVIPAFAGMTGRADALELKFPFRAVLLKERESMTLFKAFLREEAEFFRKHKTSLVVFFTLVLTISIFLIGFFRTLKPSERSLNALAVAICKTSLSDKMQILKVSLALNLEGNRIYDKHTMVGRVYVEYYEAMDDIILVVNYGKDTKNAMVCFIDGQSSFADIKRFVIACKADFSRRKKSD